jgi:anthranilate/para-aminobenzoate synthase component II
VFSGIPSPFEATRYHSLLVERASFPDCLEITAETEEEEIMGLRHKEYPIHGVQFHPESILTLEGKRLLQNFLLL